MKYAIEVARTGSLSKAAETLLVAQPNLSRSIKELEQDLHLTIFDRSSQGMHLTPEGEQFIGYAKKILRQIEDIEEMYKTDFHTKEKFSISVPRTSYIADAFTDFSKELGNEPVELFYKETNALRAMNNILHSDYNLGIVRYSQNYDKYFKQNLMEKGLCSELICEFHYVLVMSKNSPLAKKDPIVFSDLEPHIEIAHADPYVPSLSLAQVKKEEIPDNIDRRIFVFERASQFELLSENSDTFMWVSPAPQKLLKRYNLVQKECSENTKMYRDVLIYRKDYKLSDLDKKFIDALYKAKQRNFN